MATSRLLLLKEWRRLCTREVKRAYQQQWRLTSVHTTTTSYNQTQQQRKSRELHQKPTIKKTNNKPDEVDDSLSRKKEAKSSINTDHTREADELSNGFQFIPMSGPSTNGKSKKAQDPIPRAIPPPPTPHDVIVLFDLETTSLRGNSDICQIGALVLGEEEVWLQYLVPTVWLSPEVTCLTGLSVGFRYGRKVLCKHGCQVPAKNYKDGIKGFYDYLYRLSRKQREIEPAARLILLGHNCRSFDSTVLLNAFEKIGITNEQLNKLRLCFSDSLIMLKNLRKQNHPLLYSPDDDKKLSLSLGSLHNHLFPNESFTGHDSIEDIKAMERILFHPELGITESIIRDNTFLNKKQNVME